MFVIIVCDSQPLFVSVCVCVGGGGGEVEGWKRQADLCISIMCFIICVTVRNLYYPNTFTNLVTLLYKD